MGSKVFGSFKNENGNILVVTLMILFAISVIGGTVAMISSVDLKISGNQRKTTQSLFIAEAGLNEAIHRISLPNPTNVTVGGWTGNAAIGDTEPYDPNWTTRIYLTNPGNVPTSTLPIVSTGTMQDPNQPYLDYSVPEGTEQVLTVQHKWRDLDGNGVRSVNEIVRYDALHYPPENYSSGYPVEIVTVTGRSANGARVIQAEVTKRTIMVRTLGALYVDKAVKITGNSAFCGYNHDMNTPAFTTPNACFAWHYPGGNLPGITSTGDVVKVMGSSDVAGYPVPVDIDSSNPFYSLAEVLGFTDAELNDLLANADNTSIVDPLDGITYITGDANITSNLTGEGLLYVTGDLHAAGSYIYKGLIYVEGDVHFTGTPWILGSMIVRGTSDFNFSSGNAAVLYSLDAISYALNGFMPCIVLSWQEM
jgi:hypothetical protein